jgi:hypothetical protein
MGGTNLKRQKTNCKQKTKNPKDQEPKTKDENYEVPNRTLRIV